MPNRSASPNDNEFASASEHAPRQDGSEPFSEAEEVSDEAEGEEEETSRGRRRQAALSDEESDDGEDLFDDRTLRRDYHEDPEQDRYDPAMLDDSTRHKDLTGTQKSAADAEIKRREKERAGVLRSERTASGGRATGQSGILALFANMMGSDDEEELDESEEGKENKARRRLSLRERVNRVQKPDSVLVDQARSALPECDLIQLGGSRGMAMAPWKLWSERIEELITMIFEGFLWGPHAELSMEGEDLAAKRPKPAIRVEALAQLQGSPIPLYIDKIHSMVREEKMALLLDWAHVHEFAPRLCDWITNVPSEVLGVFDKVATRVTSLMFPKLYANKPINVRIGYHPTAEYLRSLNVNQMNKLIVVEGVCMRRSDVLPRLNVIFYECLKCGCDSNGPYDQRNLEQTKMKKTCVACQGGGPFQQSRERTIFQNYQKIVLQEITSSVPPGHVPRQKLAILLGDLVDAVRPGDDVIVTGILEARQDAVANARTGFPIFPTWIIVNHIQKRRERQIREMSDRDIEMIKRLSRNPMVREKIISSIAPSIWGHRHAKTAIAMAMFGGVRSDSAAKHVIRGDINVLLIGDPGMGKSQFLKFVEQTFPRTVLTTGKGASAVGLTAAVRRDPISGEWTLEGGAFVLADEGICLIDEFDKMSDKDRVSIHEAMEQQSISISKAGIVTSLRARCAVIAAANPIGGRYNVSLTLGENVTLSDPILSRFDIVVVIRDQSYPVHDEHLALHVLDSHIQAHPDADTRGVMGEQAAISNEADLDTSLDPEGYPKWIRGNGRVPDNFLRQYIIYARKWCKPEMRTTDQSRLTEFYVSLRQATSRTGGLPMTVRHLESVMRMAAANAKIRLSRFIERCDVDFAISTTLESFIQSQKYAISIPLGRQFGKYRALATSPDEVLDNLVSEMLTRQIRGNISSNDLFKRADDKEVVTQAEVTLEEFKMLAKSLHGMPEVIVQKFTDSARFKAHYSLVQKSGELFVQNINLRAL